MYCFCIFVKFHKAMEIQIPMIKQRKLKYKKNFDKRFHWNINEFAVSRTQKNNNNKKKNREKFRSFLLISLETLTGKAIGTVFSEIQCFSRSIRPEMFLKKRKKFAKLTGVKCRWWSLLFTKLTPAQIFFCENRETFKSTFL